MPPARMFFDPGIVVLAAFALIVAAVIAWSIPRAYAFRKLPFGRLNQLFLALAVAGATAYGVTGEMLGTGFAVVVVGLGALLVGLWLPRLSTAGAMEMALLPASFVIVTPWAYLLLSELAFTSWFLGVFVVGSVFGLPLTGLAFAVRLANESLLTHAVWRRPIEPLPECRGPGGPKVSIHVPCYSEPPDIVISTIDRLAQLTYSNFEVIVCDNNTVDESLWRPVRAHCAFLNAQLGQERFRFFHVAPLSGAKAGALNFCLKHTAEDAELVAVVDADYHSEPDFLSRLVGFFADPRIGFIQTPHDYREWRYSAYQRLCYWEYMPNNKVDLASLQEYDAAYTIGTMCILRRRAIEEAGGWAEWCLTEDSEISIRIRALGYEGIYLRDTFGRGLIPETFDNYKKQRFRWTAGPVQQLCRHWRLYLPQPWAAPSRMRGWAKLLEPRRSLSLIGLLLAPLFALVGILVGALTAHGHLPRIVLPDAAWIGLGLGILAGLVRVWHRYRLSGCRRIRDMIGGLIAKQSLIFVTMVGALAGLSNRPLAWRRTPKFKAKRSGLQPYVSTLPEAGIGLGLLVLLSLPLCYRDEIGDHFALLGGLVTLFAALPFLCAPVMAYLSERDLMRDRAPEPARSTLDPSRARGMVLSEVPGQGRADR